MRHNKHFQLMMTIPLMRIILYLISLLPHTTIRIVKGDVLTVRSQHLYVNFWQLLGIHAALLIAGLCTATFEYLILLQQIILQIRLIAYRHNVIVIYVLGNITMWLFRIGQLLATSIYHVLVMHPQSVLEAGRAAVVWYIVVEVKVDDNEENKENCKCKVFSLNSHHHCERFHVNSHSRITDTSCLSRIEPCIKQLYKQRVFLR